MTVIGVETTEMAGVLLAGELLVGEVVRITSGEGDFRFVVGVLRRIPCPKRKTRQAMITAAIAANAVMAFQSGFLIEFSTFLI
jgi:hypothetical protein